MIRDESADGANLCGDGRLDQELGDGEIEIEGALAAARR